jgi:hypothetical protein
MPRYQVTGKVSLRFYIDVEAPSEEEAEEKVEGMGYGELVEKAGMPDVEVEDVVLLKRKKKV